MQESTRQNFLFSLLTSHEVQSIAREALQELSLDTVGQYLGVTYLDGSPLSEDLSTDTAVYHFESLEPGYRGWEWVVMVAITPETGEVTISDMAHIAGENAPRAPEWIPYEDRLRPGDLQPGDQMPPRHKDDRLAPPEAIQNDRGFDRNDQAEKVLSPTGLDQALSRWRKGDYGPSSEYALKSERDCQTCAFFLPLAPRAREEEGNHHYFGICSNEYSADGHVVHEHYGCGAHSDTPVPDNHAYRPYGVYDDEELL